MQKDQFQKSFTVNVVGDLTMEKWVGSFTVKTRLSHRDRLRIDQLRRDFLGGMADGPAPSQDALSTAVVLAELRVRVVDAPQWWDGQDYGAEMHDANVVSEVYKLAITAEAEAAEALRKKAEAARQTLREEVKRLPPEDMPEARVPNSTALLPE